MGEFDSIKIGVCDIFWTPAPSATVTNPAEVFLGLTKGGVELTYTPEFKELTVDQFGKTPVEQVLIGETVVVKAPLAETSLDKLKMFSHTGTWDPVAKKLTFGSLPGLKLGNQAGRLRLHPIANGTDSTEDVTVYKAVNKGALKLNYKVEDETIYECEFNGMIKRSNASGAYLWEIGDSTTSLIALKSDLSNLEALVASVSGDFVVTPSLLPTIYGTADPSATPPKAKVTGVACSVEYSTVEYTITDKVTYTKSNPVCSAYGVVDSASAGSPVSVVSINSTTGVFTAVDSVTLKTYFKNGINLVDGDVITTAVSIVYANKTQIVTVKVVV